MLLWADCERRVDIRAKLSCNDAFITRWTQAFEFQGLAGLVSLHPGRAPVHPVAKLEAHVLNKTLNHKPKDGSTHWSSLQALDRKDRMLPLAPGRAESHGFE